MDILERVIKMQSSGTSDSEISRQLMNEGVSAKQISDAVGQARIKAAVSAPSPMEMESSFGMEQSMMPSGGDMNFQNLSDSRQINPISPPMAQADFSQYAPEAGQNFQQQYPPQENYPSYPEMPQQAASEGYPEMPQAYSGEASYPEYNQGFDTDTITEIAEQVASEKISELTKKTGDLASFKNLTEEKLKDLDERLKRIEDSIEKLQNSIIGRVGEFGEANSIIHKDLDALHNTVSKLMNPLIDNYLEMKKISDKIKK